MLDDQEGGALGVERAHLVDDLVQQRRIDASPGFVEQHDLGLGHHHTRQFQQLALAARQNARRLVRQAGQADKIQPMPRRRQRLALLPGHLRRAQPVGPETLAGLAARRHHHVLQHAHLGERTRDLEGSGQAGGKHRAGGAPGNAHAIQQHPTGRGRHEAGQAVEQRGLAGPIGPDQAADGARLQGKRDLVDRLVAAEMFGQGVHHQQPIL